MAKVRVYKLAKELSVQSALILELLDLMGREVKSDLSTLDEETAELVRQRVTVAIDTERKRLEEEQLRQELEAESTRQEEEPAPEPEEAPEEEPEPVEEVEAEEAPPEVEEEPAEVEAPPAPEPAPAAPVPVAAAPESAEEKPLKPTVEEKPVRAAAPPAAAAATPPGKRPPRVFAAKVIPSKSLLRQTAGRRGAAPGAAKPPARPAAKPAVPGRPAPGRPAAAGRPGTRPGVGPGPAAPPRVPGGTAKRRRKKDKKAERQAPPAVAKRKTELPPVPSEITLSEGVTVKELAEKLNRKSKDVISKLITRGVLATINQPLDPDVAVEVAKEFGAEAKVISFEEQAQQEAAPAAATAPADTEGEAAEAAEPDRPELLEERPPVVTVMGHVDHGKTSLLDAIREANVVAGESGGITQHIGAYQVDANGRKVTFLDTPGHEAFTMMRARGARATDIVVLVVAADDGVKPQTLEAIDHAKAAGVPLVVAINKIDRPEAQPMRVKQQLADRDLLVEEYGGDVVSCEVSAKQRTGIDELLEMILLVADLQELKANPNKPASGVILEARLDRARGVLATVLVQDGTLKVGEPFIAGMAHGKVRAMVDENGARVVDAGPSTPVEVMGLTGEPAAGDSFQAVAEEAKARQIASFRQEKAKLASMATSSRMTLERLALEIREGEIKELPILLKADVQGSIEALQKALDELPRDKVRVSVVRSGIGAISQADVLLASASNAIIVGFNVRPDRATTDFAEQEKVEIRTYAVIYELIDEMKQVMVGLLEPTFKENVLGQAEVRQLFKVPKIGIVGGCYVTDGKVARNAEVRLLRDHVVIYTGKVGSLRRFKDDVGEVKQGYECGIGIENYNDLKEGDVIEFFVKERVVAESL